MAIKIRIRWKTSEADWYKYWKSKTNASNWN